VHVPEGVVFTGAIDVAALYDLAMGKRHNPALEKREPRRPDTFQHHQEGDLKLPAPLQRLGKRGLAAAQRLFYTRALQPRCGGKAMSRSTRTSSGGQPFVTPRHGAVKVASAMPAATWRRWPRPTISFPIVGAAPTSPI